MVRSNFSRIHRDLCQRSGNSRRSLAELECSTNKAPGLCRSDKRKTQSYSDFEIDVGDGKTGVQGSALAQRVGAEQNSCYGRMVTAHNRAKSIGRETNNPILGHEAKGTWPTSPDGVVWITEHAEKIASG